MGFNSQKSQEIEHKQKNGNDLSQIFLHDNVAKHVLCLSYKARLPGSEVADSTKYSVSCFVVEIEGHWFLVTAGHVITDIKDNIGKGVIYYNFILHDQLAGNKFPPIPYSFDVKDWVVIDTDGANYKVGDLGADANGMDYAAVPLRHLFKEGLISGGIQVIQETAWGPEPFDQYSNWLLVGIPNESHHIVAGIDKVKMTIIPLKPTDPPMSTIKPPSKNKVYAQIIRQPEIDSVQVKDIAGMSGGPIFALTQIDNQLRYWVIGIQSSQYSFSDIVAFCPALHFFEGLKEAIQRLNPD